MTLATSGLLVIGRPESLNVLAHLRCWEGEGMGSKLTLMSVNGESWRLTKFVMLTLELCGWMNGVKDQILAFVRFGLACTTSTAMASTPEIQELNL